MKPQLRTSLQKSLITLTALSLLGCAKGFQSSVPAEDAANTALTAPAPNTPDLSQKVWADAADGSNAAVENGSSGYFPVGKGNLLVQIDKERQSVVLILPLPPAFLMQLTSIQIPQLPGAGVEMVTQADGSQAMGVVIPLKYLIRGSSFGQYGVLPNGDAIPFIPAGEARGFSIDFSQRAKYRLHIYMAANAAAAFIETPDWKLPSQVSGFLPTLGFPLKNKGKTEVVGYLAFVPNRADFSSGIYVASRIPRQLAVALDEVLRY